eukprot:CAMPEP_0170876482 /NCGR_PEP_ID=MMETSP0734-20130129/29658_1 /TAXON_ID=186038 /ORGANISM="Fragilariopsis kerguelensis, Strain L26-C5" /LENGTH=61 /DNA_ID=CAMNT_0011258407 /DNA_START=12 /DNA_END=197 /DNA_ORIENTATION=+
MTIIGTTAMKGTDDADANDKGADEDNDDDDDDRINFMIIRNGDNGTITERIIIVDMTFVIN